GLGEAGNFPAAVKTVAEWFPKSERALATGIFNSGSNVGAVVGPLVVPYIALHWGWRWAFVATGAIGFTWIVPWMWLYRTPDARERSYAGHGAVDTQHVSPIPWLRLIPHRET